MVELPLVVVDVQRAGPSTGHADQERAGGPAAGHVRAQQRLAAADRRAGHARRMLRHRHRGVADRAQVHDPGRLPLGRLPGDRLRAVADPVVDDLPRIGVDNATDPATFRPYAARSRDAGPTVGRAGHARARAPHRRSREGRHHGQRQLRPGQPPPDAALRQAEGRRHRQGHPAARRVRAGPRRAADPRLGLDLRRHPLARSSACTADGRVRGPRAPAPPQPVPGATPATCCAATSACSSRRSTWASC